MIFEQDDAFEQDPECDPAGRQDHHQQNHRYQNTAKK